MISDDRSVVMPCPLVSCNPYKGLLVSARCVQVGIQGPVGSDGKVPAVYWADVSQVELVKAPRQVVRKPRTCGSATGGPAGYTGGATGSY